MNPTLEQLARYVMQELGRGVPEVTLYNSLRESGWTQEWITPAFSAAKQRAMPAGNDMNIPMVQQAAPVQSAKPVTPVQPAAPKKPSAPIKPRQPRVRTDRSALPIKKYMVILVAILGLILVGLGTFRILEAADNAATLRMTRDADRREDLSVLLSNLSDYYVAHNSYPTRTQLNTESFAKENNFSADSITDPKWTTHDTGCVKDSKAQLAGVVADNCYVYEVTSADNGICNNGSMPCTKVKVTIPLEVEKTTYSVIFSKNKQVDS